MSHSFRPHLSICTRHKSKQRPRGVKWFFQYHIESIVGYLRRSQIAPRSSSLKQCTISQFLCIRNWAQPRWVLCFRVSSEGCSQYVSQGWDIVWNSHLGKSPRVKLIYTVVGGIQILKGVGLRTSVSCWLLAGGFPLSFATWASTMYSLHHQN